MQDNIWILESSETYRTIAIGMPGSQEIAFAAQGIAGKGAHDEGEWVQAYDGATAVTLSIKAFRELIRITPEILQVICGPSVIDG